MTEKIVVIGGGPAGIIIARLLHKQRDDVEVILIEKSNHLGYQSSTPYVKFQYGDKFRSAMFLTSEPQMRSAGIQLMMRQNAIQLNEFTQHLILESGIQIHYDKLVIATGLDKFLIENTIDSRNCSEIQNLKEKLDEKLIKKILILGTSIQALKLGEALFEKYQCEITFQEQKPRLNINVEDEVAELIVKQFKQAQFQYYVPIEKSLQEKEKFDAVINCLQDSRNEKLFGNFQLKQNQIPQNNNIYAIGSCIVNNITQSFIFSQCVYLTNLIFGKQQQKIKEPVFLQNEQFIIKKQYFGRVGKALFQVKSAKLIKIKDSYRAEFMPTHHAVQLYMVVEDQSKLILGFQATSRHDITQLLQVCATVIAGGMTAPQLILQDFFFQPHFSKPLHLLNTCAIAACGSVPPYEEYKQQ